MLRLLRQPASGAAARYEGPSREGLRGRVTALELGAPLRGHIGDVTLPGPAGVDGVALVVGEAVRRRWPLTTADVFEGDGHVVVIAGEVGEDVAHRPARDGVFGDARLGQTFDEPGEVVES